MTENEALEYIKNMAFMCGEYEKCQYGHQCTTKCLKATEIAIKALSEVQQYRAIGTIEEFKALKEKATPKKNNNDSARCKNCGTYNNFIVDNLFNPKGHPVVYCWNCGQAIDWRE